MRGGYVRTTPVHPVRLPSRLIVRSASQPDSITAADSGLLMSSRPSAQICVAATWFGLSPIASRRMSSAAVHESAPPDRATSHE
jgi:hypothetical protein